MVKDKCAICGKELPHDEGHLYELPDDLPSPIVGWTVRDCVVVCDICNAVIEKERRDTLQ